MTNGAIEAHYDETSKAIRINGETVIDLSSVQDQARVVMHSKYDPEDAGIETTLKIGRGKRPFDFGAFVLGPNGLLASIKENHLEIEGMKICADIETAYSLVWGENRMRRLVGNYGRPTEERELEIFV